MSKATERLKEIIKSFDNWEKEILLNYESDMDIFLINFIHDTDKGDFLHNIADVLFRCKSNSLAEGRKEVLQDILKYGSWKRVKELSKEMSVEE